MSFSLQKFLCMWVVILPTRFVKFSIFLFFGLIGFGLFYLLCGLIFVVRRENNILCACVCVLMTSETFVDPL